MRSRRTASVIPKKINPITSQISIIIHIVIVIYYFGLICHIEQITNRNVI